MEQYIKCGAKSSNRKKKIVYINIKRISGSRGSSHGWILVRRALSLISLSEA